MASEEFSAESKRTWRGLLVPVTLLLALAVGVVTGYSYIREQSQLALKKHEAEWKQRCFDLVKKDGHHVGHVHDARILPMFAGDGDCIRRLEQLSFDMVTVSPPLAAFVSQLKNVQSIEFYDTRGADHVLANASSLPIRTIFFHQAEVSADSLRRLAGFSKLNAVYLHQVLSSEELDILKSLPETIAVGLGYPPNAETSDHRGDEREW